MPFHADLLAEGIRSWCSVPLVVEEGIIGLLCLGSDVPGAFDDEHLDIAGEIAGQTSIALHHARLRQQIQDYTTHLEEYVEQRTAEIEQVTERVEAILNNTSDAVILAYGDGTIIQTNPMFDRLFGYSPDALFHQSLTTIIHPVDHARFQELLDAVIQDGQIKQVEITACRSDQSAFFAEIGMSLVPSKKHPRGSIVCSLHDVTERKRAEEELRRTLEKERELGELRTHFISMTSHEFRTPLATITSSAELLTHYFDRMGSEQRSTHLGRITAAIQSMTLLLEDTMLFGKAEAGRLEAKCAPVDFGQLCQEVLGETQDKTDLKLIFTQPERLPMVCTDENLVRRILTNLLSNAVKYSRNGTPVQLALDGEAERVIVRVIDQGIGIPAQDLARLGDPFHRAQNVGKIPGNGLGFAITRQAVALLGGTIDIQSEVGKGTTVMVTLPYSPAPQIPAGGPSVVAG
jgi:PAS domain S-box-containing protein